MTTTLQQHREKKGLSREIVAQRLQINTGSYWRIETGNRGVSLPVAEKLALILDVPWTKLFTPKIVVAFANGRPTNGKKAA